MLGLVQDFTQPLTIIKNVYSAYRLDENTKILAVKSFQ
ncbi:hypothetical protein GXM_03181 [Nostoc sphaeroides CCNUC1]|uniref:Uncharacterized protein n=1 Tax=Nostoc sphaeroides CCNUC1 TaxID=2653204 RepID=A0A5P8VZ73_9NOSO|nr:hypothetical protein GXM_03181 [Nostoc sphaeroides CCNUC1]